MMKCSMMMMMISCETYMIIVRMMESKLNYSDIIGIIGQGYQRLIVCPDPEYHGITHSNRVIQIHLTTLHIPNVQISVLRYRCHLLPVKKYFAHHTCYHNSLDHLST